MSCDLLGKIRRCSKVSNLLTWIFAFMNPHKIQVLTHLSCLAAIKPKVAAESGQDSYSGNARTKICL